MCTRFSLVPHLEQDIDFIITPVEYISLYSRPTVSLLSIISIFHGCVVWIEKSVTRVTDRHHEACRMMPNSDP